jgi:hypothetical protein
MDQLRDLGKAFAIEAGVESTISNGGAARGIGATRPSSAKQQSPVRPTSAKAGGAGGAFRPASAGPRGMMAHSSDGALVELPSLEIHEAADKSVYACMRARFFARACVHVCMCVRAFVQCTCAHARACAHARDGFAWARQPQVPVREGRR